MTDPLSLRESERIPLALLVGEDANAEVREAARARVAGLGSQLRIELGLRQDALVVEESAIGPVVKTQGVAGTLIIGVTTLDIRPKHVDDPNDPTWQNTLLVMMERASRRRAAYSRSNRLKLGAGTFIDQLAMGLALELEEATRHPEVRAYQSSREELGQLRGRLLVTEQLRSSLLKPHKVICEVDELSGDNPVNRLLHWATQQLAALATQPSVRRALSVQAGRLPRVTQPVKAPTRLSFQLPRQYHHYAGAVELASAFARGWTTSYGARQVAGAGFLIGTERLFESFVERSLSTALAGHQDWQVSAQERSLFAEPVGGSGRGRRAYYSKPDNVVRRGDAVTLLVDAKYKRFEDETDETTPGRPSNGDLYQMAAACVAHDCPRALLVYPRMSHHDTDRDWEPSWWEINFGGVRLRVGTVTVPLHLVAATGGLVDFDRRLRSLVMSAASPLSAASSGQVSEIAS